MSDRPRVSIQAQAGHVNWLCNLADRLGPEAIKRGLTTGKETTMRAEYSSAVVGTMKWLVANEAEIRLFLTHREEIRALLAMTPEDRAVILFHGPMVAGIAREIADREAMAQAGGPTR
jgi:hypothetical protein